MLDFATQIRVQVMDVIPGIVLTRVTDALRARGLEVDVRGEPCCASDEAIDVQQVWDTLPDGRDVTWLFLTSRPLRSAESAQPASSPETQFAAFERRAAIVSCSPTEATRAHPQSARRVAHAVVDGPLAALCG